MNGSSKTLIWIKALSIGASIGVAAVASIAIRYHNNTMDRLASSQQRVQDEQKQVQQARKTAVETEQQLAQVTATNTSQGTQIAKLQGDAAAWQKERDEHQKEINDLKSALARLTQERDSLFAQHKLDVDSIRELSGQAAAIEDKARQKQYQLDEKTHQNAQLADEVSVLSDQVAKLSHVNTEFKQTLTKLGNAYATLDEDNRKQLVQIAEINAMLEKSMAENQTLRVKLDERAQHVKQMETQQAIVVQENNVLRSQQAVVKIEERHRSIVGRNLAQREVGFWGWLPDVVGNGVGKVLETVGGNQGEPYWIAYQADGKPHELSEQETISLKNRGVPVVVIKD